MTNAQIQFSDRCSQVVPQLLRTVAMMFGADRVGSRIDRLLSVLLAQGEEYDDLRRLIVALATGDLSTLKHQVRYFLQVQSGEVDRPIPLDYGDYGHVITILGGRPVSIQSNTKDRFQWSRLSLGDRIRCVRQDARADQIRIDEKLVLEADETHNAVGYVIEIRQPTHEDHRVFGCLLPAVSGDIIYLHPAEIQAEVW